MRICRSTGRARPVGEPIASGTPRRRASTIDAKNAATATRRAVRRRRGTTVSCGRATTGRRRQSSGPSVGPSHRRRRARGRGLRSVSLGSRSAVATAQPTVPRRGVSAIRSTTRRRALDARRFSACSVADGVRGKPRTMRTVCTASQTHGNSGGHSQPPVTARRMRSLTIRSSPEWYDSTATRPPMVGARDRGVEWPAPAHRARR